MDCELGLSFPKFVKIKSTRLAIFYYILSVVSFSYVIFTVVSTKSYLNISAPKGRVASWVDDWFGPLAYSKAHASNLLDAEKPFCKYPELYDYCSENPCVWDFKEMQCVDLCAGNVSKPGCVSDG